MWLQVQETCDTLSQFDLTRKMNKERKSDLKEKDREIQQWKKAMEIKESVIESIQNEFRTAIETQASQLAPLFGKAKASSTIGILGENIVEEILNKICTTSRGIKFENVSGQRESGDFRISYARANVSLLIEVKNYKNKVPKKELEKFWNDLQSNHYNGGIMLSLKSGIASDVHDFNVQDLRPTDKKYMLIFNFITSFSENRECVLELALSLLVNAIEYGRDHPKNTRGSFNIDNIFLDMKIILIYLHY